jgi:hypothetical protein
MMSARVTTRPPPPQVPSGISGVNTHTPHRVAFMGAVFGVEHRLGDSGEHLLAAFGSELALGYSGLETIAGRGGRDSRRFSSYVRPSRSAPLRRLSSRAGLRPQPAQRAPPTLVAEGILSREPYHQPGHRVRFEYRLTDKGQELFPALVALMRWGGAWTVDAAGPPVDLLHRGCGQPVSVELSCADGHGHLSARDTQAIPGTGAKPAKTAV